MTQSKCTILKYHYYKICFTRRLKTVVCTQKLTWTEAASTLPCSHDAYYPWCRNNTNDVIRLYPLWDSIGKNIGILYVVGALVIQRFYSSNCCPAFIQKTVLSSIRCWSFSHTMILLYQLLSCFHSEDGFL